MPSIQRFRFTKHAATRPNLSQASSVTASPPPCRYNLIPNVSMWPCHGGSNELFNFIAIMFPLGVTFQNWTCECANRHTNSFLLWSTIIFLDERKKLTGVSRLLKKKGSLPTLSTCMHFVIRSRNAAPFLLKTKKSKP